MKYSEAKKVLEQQEAAKAIMVKYEKLVSAHKEHGFSSRRELIQALQEIDKAESGKARGKGKARGTRGLSPDSIDQIRKLKSEGKSNAEIARTTGVSPLTVAKYVKGVAGKARSAKAGKAPSPKRKIAAKGKKGGRGLSPKSIGQIKTMKSEGKTNAEIARTTGVSPMTVAKYVKGEATNAAAALAPAAAPAQAKVAAKVKTRAKAKAPAKRRARKAKAEAKK